METLLVEEKKSGDKSAGENECEDQSIGEKIKPQKGRVAKKRKKPQDEPFINTLYMYMHVLCTCKHDVFICVL